MAKESRELQDWKQRLMVSHRKHDIMEKNILLYRNYYKNEQWNVNHAGSYSHKVIDNLIFSNIRTILPRLNIRNPKIFVTANKKPYQVKDQMFDTIQGSIVLEIVLNYYYKQLKLKRETRKCLVDALLGYWGILQLGYSVETENIKNDGDETETNELIKEDSPYAVRRSPLDFRFDTEATDHLLLDGRWVSFRWIKPLEDVKSDPKYSNTRFLKSNYRAKTDFKGAGKITEYSGDEPPDLWGRVEGWDIWDKKTHKLITIVEDHPKLLQETDWPLAMDGFPCEILYFNENPDEAEPLPDIKIYKESQDELNIIRSLQLDHIKRISQRKYKTRENSMTEEEKDKVTYGGDGVIVEVKGDPNTTLLPVQDAVISQDIYMVAQLLKNAARENAGISGAEALSPQKFEQATEPALIHMASQTLRDDQRSIFEDFVVRCVSKLGKIIQQTTETSKEIPLSLGQFKEAQSGIPDKLEKIVGPDKTTIYPWLSFNNDDIKGDFEYSIEIGSTQPINDASRQQQAKALAEYAASNPLLDPEKVTMRVLESYGEKNPEDLMIPMEQVQAGKQQAMEAAIQAEIQKVMPKIMADLQKTDKKTATSIEIAEIKSKTDIVKEALKVDKTEKREKD